MASCSQIERLLTAYVDGELKHSEVVIVEEHVAGCAQCARLLVQNQRAAALLFETFGGERLQESLRERVLERLPGREPDANDELAGLNWRAKHPGSWCGKAMHRLPLAVGLILAVMAMVIRFYWPSPDGPGADSIGMFTRVSGAVEMGPDTGDDRPARVRHFVGQGVRVNTREDGLAVMALAGSTQVKLNVNTRVTLMSERHIRLDFGDMWLHVGENGGRFVVETPDTRIRVMGTLFLVEAREEQTAVTVMDGEVLLDAHDADHRFLEVTPGRRAVVAGGLLPESPVEVDCESAALWADALVPDREAQDLFARAMPAGGGASTLSARRVFYVPTLHDGHRWDVEAVRLYWDETPEAGLLRCDYDMLVYDGNMTPLFSTRVTGATLMQPGVSSCRIPVPGGPAKGLNALIVRLMPDLKINTVETEFRVKADGS
jgi:hypothetical protein